MEKRTESKQRFERKPSHEFKVSVSEDGRYWIFKNIETWVIPAKYIETIYTSKVKPNSAATDEQAQGDG